MLRSLRSILEFRIHGTNGYLGKLREISAALQAIMTRAIQRRMVFREQQIR